MYQRNHKQNVSRIILLVYKNMLSRGMLIVTIYVNGCLCGLNGVTNVAC